MNVLSEIKSSINNWWLFLLLGIIMLVGGIYVFNTPLESYITLSLFFAFIILADGIGSIFFSLSNRHMDGWGWQLANGILSAFIGGVLFIHPEISMSILPLFVGFWIIIKGGMIIGVSLDLKKISKDGWAWMLFLGILNILFGIAIIANPIIGVSLIIFITAFSLMIMGISLILISFKFRKLKLKVEDLKENASEKFQDLKQKLKTYANEKSDNPQDTLKKIQDLLK